MKATTLAWSDSAMEYNESFRMARRAALVNAAVAYKQHPIFGAASNRGEAPAYFSRSQGAYVWDLDGNKYLDCVLGFGSVILGHCDADVEAAVIEQLRKGVAATLSTPHECKLAELLRQFVPGAEVSLFLKTGSDATSAAVRIARAFTGRERILRWGYHGWHDWCANRPGGVVKAARELTNDFKYNDVESLKWQLEMYAGEVACVVMMPYELQEPRDEFLSQVGEVARLHGALFILDEVRSGFRLALGGAQQHYGVEADLVALSKAMANGFCISAVCGSQTYLRAIGDLSISSVFFRGGLEMAAAIATIEKLAATNPYPRMWELGRHMCDGLDAEATRTGVPARVTGLPITPFLTFDYGDEEMNQHAMSVFVAEMLSHGILLHPSHHWFLCASTSDDDVESTIRAAGQAFSVVRDAARRQ